MTKKNKSKEELFIEALLSCSNLKQFRNGQDTEVAKKVLESIIGKNNSSYNQDLNIQAPKARNATSSSSKKASAKKSKESKANKTPLSSKITPDCYLEKFITPKRLIELRNKTTRNANKVKQVKIDSYFTEYLRTHYQTTDPERQKKIKLAEIALQQLSPGKKALLESLFNTEECLSIKELSVTLNEPEEKIIKLKDEALRSLIYKS